MALKYVTCASMQAGTAQAGAGSLADLVQEHVGHVRGTDAELDTLVQAAREVQQHVGWARVPGVG